MYIETIGDGGGKARTNKECTAGDEEGIESWRRWWCDMGPCLAGSWASNGSQGDEEEEGEGKAEMFTFPPSSSSLCLMCEAQKLLSREPPTHPWNWRAASCFGMRGTLISVSLSSIGNDSRIRQ